MKLKSGKTNSEFGQRNNNSIQTPEWLYKELELKYGKFDFDPCPINPTFNGLEIKWGKNNFVNPPYSNTKKWVKKAIKESSEGRQVVMLIPARTSSKYWHNDIFPKASEILFIQGYIQFVDYTNKLPLSLSIVVFNNTKCIKPLKNWTGEKGLKVIKIK